MHHYCGVSVFESAFRGWELWIAMPRGLQSSIPTVLCLFHVTLLTYLQGPRTHILGFSGPNTIILLVFGP